MAPRPEEFDPKTIEQKEDEINDILKSKGNHVDLLKEKKYERQLVWRNILLFIYLHSAAAYGLYLMLYAKYQTNLYGELIE